VVLSVFSVLKGLLGGGGSDCSNDLLVKSGLNQYCQTTKPVKENVPRAAINNGLKTDNILALK
jgi:hypothetical protein